MKTSVREFIQCRTFLRVLCRLRNARSVCYTQSVMLSSRFIPESVFYTQSVVRSPQSMFYTDRFPIMYEDRSLLEAGDRLQMF